MRRHRVVLLLALLLLMLLSLASSLARGQQFEAPSSVPRLLPAFNADSPPALFAPPVPSILETAQPGPEPHAEEVVVAGADDQGVSGEGVPVDEALVDEALVDEALVDEPPVAYVWYQPAYWLGPAPWDTSIELGVNGSSGTSDSFSIRTGGSIDRESERRKLALSLYYNNTKADGLTTQSNALLNGRHDWLFGGDSPWSLFALSQVFYDEFQAFDLNVNVNGGLGYDVLKKDAVTLGTSFGAGASREFGAPDEEWTPEAQFGVNYEQKVAGAHKVYAKVDYFPEWENFNNYRVLTDVGLEMELSRPSNASLKLSATDRFDSSPNGVPPHNTNYSVLLLWKL